MCIRDILEYDPRDYEKLLTPFFEANADVVYGSRFLGGGKYVRIHFFWHYLANKILTFICNLFINLNYRIAGFPFVHLLEQELNLSHRYKKEFSANYIDSNENKKKET